MMQQNIFVLHSFIELFIFICGRIVQRPYSVHSSFVNVKMLCYSLSNCDVTGMQAYADALLIIPKVLAQNSGMDQQETIVKLQEEYRSVGQPVGLDINTGKFHFRHYVKYWYGILGFNVPLDTV